MSASSRTVAPGGARLLPGTLQQRVAAAVADIAPLVPPVWPLADYVAVNPFLGFAPARFLDARRMLRSVRDCELLMPATVLATRFDRGEIEAGDVELAFRQCVEEYPELYAGLEIRSLTATLRELAAGGGVGIGERRYHTVTEAIDARLGSSWTSHVVTDVSRHCAAHEDRGQAAWPNPWRHLSLYEAWRESSRISRRLELLGVPGFRRFVEALPTDAEEAVGVLLERLAIPERHWRSFLLCQLSSVAGWASYLTYRLRESRACDAGTHDEHLTGLLAMRLAYDVALAEVHPTAVSEPGALHPGVAEGDAEPAPPSAGVLARYLYQVAAEVAYRRRLTVALTGTVPAVPAAATRRTLQMVFCIDVRSEVFRRHLEATSNEVATLGFAGFFGMPLEFVPLGATHGPAQCPVLLQPGFRVHERIRGAGAADNARAAEARRMVRQARKVWKTFQASATSCFSFVESLGLVYLPKLVSDSLGWTRPVLPSGGDGVPRRSRAALGPDLHGSGPDALTLERKVDLACGMLRNLGLTEHLARIVAICGHGSEVVNNPYKAGYDCGACGGHSGEPNARVAAALLNDPAVRAGVAGRGIAIPDDTWFVAAVHVTTTDEIRFPDAAEAPVSHREEFSRVRGWLDRAGAATRLERSRRLGAVAADDEAELDVLAAAGPTGDAARDAATADIFRRARDWSEVRPEWGLAGNAAFIVAPRHRTAGLDLGGRTFLHDYDHAKDPQGAVLELIMTAPMIVTSWINLQYYASAVDNRAFGAGNKLIHNVTGQIGTLCGNGGDLMTGLPWQAVSDGTRLQHEPLRLLVLIEAPREAVQRVIERHEAVRDLVSNGWLLLVVRDADAFHRWTADREWQPEPVRLDG
jgi:uncharacterized protein YbcC (UPF0753/DUF2309 family)